MTEREITNYNWLAERILYYTDVNVLDKKRTRENVNARVVFCKIAKETFWSRVGHIGEFLGKNHATVIHSVKGFDVVKNYEHKFYKAFQLILLELEGEEMIVKHFSLGMIGEIDERVLNYRESIKEKVNKITELVENN
tara:strand:+ start:178 stop:591 length:414 start_codon:yes stop_codon:yes gene_type:complete